MSIGAIVSVAAVNLLHAQTRAPEIGIGAGYHYLWYPEASTGGLGLRGSARLPLSPTLALEPDVAYSRATRSQLFDRPQPARTTSARMTWTAGLNVIVSRPTGSVRPYAGGGAGLFVQRRVFETRVGSGAGADVHRSESLRGPRLIGQGVAGLDVQAARSTAVFAELRVDALTVAGGAVGFSYLGGVRIALR